MSYVRSAGAVTPLLAFVALLVIAGDPLQAQTVPSTQVQARSETVTRLTARQRRNLIKHNDAGAIRTMHALFSAQATYQATTGNGDYGTIEQLGKEGLIDSVLAEGHRFGYLFRVRREKHSTESPQASLEIVAVPRTYGWTGRRSFYMNESGVIHYADKRGAEANAGDDLMVIDP